MTLKLFNDLDQIEAGELLTSCCGSQKWVELMMQSFPFENEKALITMAENAWYNDCREGDWEASFLHHPKIGDIKSLSEKFGSTQHLSRNEQDTVLEAPYKILQEFSEANKIFEKKFGFIFIVCATGKTAKDLLRLLYDRLKNSREEELRIAMGEQHKISILRIKKIINAADWQHLANSHLTTHVLDSSAGKPGNDITIKLKRGVDNGWQTISQGLTDNDGRITDLLPPERNLAPGNYKLIFETHNYFQQKNITSFYPEVEIQFTVFDASHYHVPLLINPFGYSTYRGS